VSYVALTLLSSASEWGVSVFVLRLFAFCLILYGIFDKNRRREANARAEIAKKASLARRPQRARRMGTCQREVYRPRLHLSAGGVTMVVTITMITTAENTASSTTRCPPT
jgi:hypothetical protein